MFFTVSPVKIKLCLNVPLGFQVSLQLITIYLWFYSIPRRDQQATYGTSPVFMIFCDICVLGVDISTVVCIIICTYLVYCLILYLSYDICGILWYYTFRFKYLYYLLWWYLYFLYKCYILLYFIICYDILYISVRYSYCSVYNYLYLFVYIVLYYIYLMIFVVFYDIILLGPNICTIYCGDIYIFYINVIFYYIL